MPDMV